MNAVTQPFGVYLTYDSEAMRDGIGAQCQRILGIAGASRLLGVGYVHTPISHIEPNPGDPQYSELQRQSLLGRANEMVKLAGDGLRESFEDVRIVKNLGLNDVHRLLKLDCQLKERGRSALVSVASPFPFADKNPILYRFPAQVIANRLSPRIDLDNVRVDVHIRRAVTPSKTISGKNNVRHVPTEWYLSVLDRISRGLSHHGGQLHIRVHTDIPKAKWKPTSGVSVQTRQLWDENVAFDSKGYLDTEGLEEFGQIFSHFGQIEVAREWDPIDALYSMVEARFLVGYASSFSYLAGILRGSRPVVSPRFWHSPMPTWCAISRSAKEHEMKKLVAYVSNHVATEAIGKASVHGLIR